MIYYWTYDIRLRSRRVQSNENINYFSKCKKYIIFTHDNIHVHCINPIQYYKEWIKITGQPINMLDEIRVEEAIAATIVDAMQIPPSAKYLAFSDTHGDICSLCIGTMLFQKYNLMTIECGDVRNYRYNLWRDRTATEYENNFRSQYSELISDFFNHQRNYFSLQGNHDKNRYLIRITIQNENRQLIFNHSLMPEDEENKLIVYKTFIYKNDTITFYKYDKNIIFYHSFGSIGENIDLLEGRIRKIITTKNFNPYIICGHDCNFMYLSKNKGKTFPSLEIKRKNLTIEEIHDDTIFGRILNTDGMLKKLLHINQSTKQTITNTAIMTDKPWNNDGRTSQIK